MDKHSKRPLLHYKFWFDLHFMAKEKIAQFILLYWKEMPVNEHRDDVPEDPEGIISAIWALSTSGSSLLATWISRAA